MTTLCNKCGNGIRWRKGLKSWIPINAVSGSDHFPTCMKNLVWEDTPAFHKSSRRIVGADYKPYTYACTCGNPPWESCLATCDRSKEVHAQALDGG